MKPMAHAHPIDLRLQGTIVLAGGGTGGHLFPAVAVAEAFQESATTMGLLFISRGNELEKRVLSRRGFDLECVDVEGLKGRGKANQLRGLIKLPVAMARAVSLLRRYRVRLVIGFGGYAAGPVVAAARLLQIPNAICEQNLRMGITNRLLAPWVDRVYVSFAATAGKIRAGRALITGNPIRRSLLQPPEIAAKGPDARPFTVLIVGGSQGAHRINTTVCEALPLLSKEIDYQFIHQTGATDEVMVRNAYAKVSITADVSSFYADMGACYHKADLVICRAGATTVAEICALGKAALLVPYPFAADNHQELNARSLQQGAAACMLLEKELTAAVLADRLNRLARQPQELAKMRQQALVFGRPHAAEAIVADCLERLAESGR